MRAETLWITWRDIAKHWTEEMESETGRQVGIPGQWTKEAMRIMDREECLSGGIMEEKKLGILFRIMDDVLNQDTIS